MTKNYLKENFYTYLKNNDDLFKKVVSSNRKFFFVWDYENQDNLWISNSIWKKLGYKSKNFEADLNFWEGKFKMELPLSFNFDIAVDNLVPKVEVEFTNIKGEITTALVNLHVIKNNDNVTRVIGILNNNWSRLALKYSVKQLEILVSLHKSSFRNFKNLKDLDQTIAIAIADGLEVSRSSMWFLKNNELVCKYLYNCVNTKSETAVKLRKSNLPQYFEALQNGIAVVASEAQKNSVTCELYENYLLPNNIKSILDIPIRENGILVGTLCCENTEIVKNWTINDISFARSIADIYTLFKEEINKQNVEKELTEQQERIAFIIDNISDGIYIVEDNKMVYKSPRYLNMIGISVEQKDKEHDIDMFHLVHTEDKVTFKNAIFSAFKNKLASVRHVFRCLKSDGQYMWREDIMNIQYNNDGKAFRAVTIARDVTEEKNKEIELKAKNKTALLQNKLLLKLFAETYNLSIENNLTIVTEIAAYGLDVDRAGYWMIENNQIVCKDLFDTTNNLHTSGATLEISKIPKYFDAINNTTELIVNDVATHIATSEIITDYLVPQGISKLLDVPVREKGKIVGILCFEKRKNDSSWSDNDITFSRSLADFLSIKFAEENQKIIETKLSENEKVLTLISDNTTDGIYVIEKKIITYLSPASKQLLKHTRKDGDNFTIDDMFNNIHPEDHGTIKKLIYSSLAQKKEAFNYEVRFRDENNAYKWREDFINVVYDSQGNYSKYIAVTRDISERKESEIEKKRLYEITEKQNDRLVNFTHIVSHDIRSHTSNMSMILDLFEGSKDKVERREYFSMLKESTEKLSETIYYLNETVAIQNKLKQEKLLINLKEAVEKSILGISAIIKTNQATININIDENFEVLGTTSYLESILFNVINNAIKYQSNFRKPIITIFATRNEQYIQLNISDNGKGIDLEKHSTKIFGMYKTFHGNSDAVGLGLFMVKNHIEAMGGKIEVESEIDKGTVFKLFFI